MMEISELTEIDALTAGEVCDRFPIEGSIRSLAGPQDPPHVFVDALLRGRYFIESIHFLVHAMTQRDVIRWAHIVVRPWEERNALPRVLDALNSAPNWLAAAGDEERLAEIREAGARSAEELELETPSAWLAAAVGHCTSTAPPEECEPKDLIWRSDAAMALVLAATQAGETFVEDDTELFIGQIQEILARGVDLASGGDGDVSAHSLDAYFQPDEHAGEIRIGAADVA